MPYKLRRCSWCIMHWAYKATGGCLPTTLLMLVFLHLHNFQRQQLHPRWRDGLGQDDPDHQFPQLHVPWTPAVRALPARGTSVNVGFMAKGNSSLGSNDECRGLSRRHQQQEHGMLHVHDVKGFYLTYNYLIKIRPLSRGFHQNIEHLMPALPLWSVILVKIIDLVQTV